MTHERITTTMEKAKELRPFVDKLIHSAKRNDYQGNLYLKQTLFTSSSIRKLKSSIVNRF
jgi:ribosomal protein L17